jgi:trehalose synthase
VAQRIVQLLKDASVRKELGARARDTVREWFLMIRMVERYLDLFAASEPRDAPDRRRLVAQA